MRDLKFTSSGVKRWIVHFYFHRYICNRCGKTFGPPEREWGRTKYGTNLLAYAIYQNIELRLPAQSVDLCLDKLFGLQLGKGFTGHIKQRAAEEYKSTYQSLLGRIRAGHLIHADETKISVDGKDGFVWVFANMEEVAYVYTGTREGDFVQTFLKDFKGSIGALSTNRSPLTPLWTHAGS